MESSVQTNKGLIKLAVMFFGMCNSLATFQSMMDNIFITMIEGKLVTVYMDDILIFAGTKEELTQVTRMVLEKLRETIYSSRPRNANSTRRKLNI